MKSVTIDRTNHLPALAFIGLKSRPQGNGGKKNRSGYAQEHKQANLDNAAFDMVQSEAKSIGGISEVGGLPEGNNDATSNESENSEWNYYLHSLWNPKEY